MTVVIITSVFWMFFLLIAIIPLHKYDVGRAYKSGLKAGREKGHGDGWNDCAAFYGVNGDFDK